MELVDIEVTGRKSLTLPYEEVQVMPIGDVQLGARGTDIDRLKKQIAWANEQTANGGPPVYFVGMGDYVDVMSPSNREAWRSARLYDSVRTAMEEKATELEEEFLKLVAGTEGRWLGLLHGHHYFEHDDGTTSDTRIAQRLKAPYLGSCAFVSLSFKSEPPLARTLRCVLWVHHGAGSGLTPQAPLNRLVTVMQYFEADVYLIGHQCVPLTTRILTRNGFKSYNQLVLGEDVLAFNTESGRNEWTPLLDVTTYDQAPVSRFSSKSFVADATPDHSWVTVDYAGRIRLATPIQWASNDALQVAAHAESGSSSITDDQAALLGWLVTDGSVRWVKKSPDWRIYQKKERQLQDIKALLTRLGVEYSTYSRKSGVTELYLHKASVVQIIEATTFITKDDLVSIVTRLSQTARAAMLDAMQAAEGDRFAQAPGPVWDAYLILNALEGRRLGRPTSGVGLGLPVNRVRTLDRGGKVGQVSVHYLTATELPPAPVWCPTTKFGTWIAEQDSLVFITGNTKRPVVPVPRIYMSDKPPYRLIARKKILAGTGGFTKGYEAGSKDGRGNAHGSYVEQGMMSPVSLGSVLIKIRPVRGGKNTVDRLDLNVEV